MIEIIPAIELIDGKSVHLTNGDFEQKSAFPDNPVETAKLFEAAGIRRLHLVDLDGASSGRLANVDVLEEIAGTTDLIIDFGGGIETDDDVKRVFDAGAEFVNLGSIAVNEPDLFFEWLEHYGAESFILGADVDDGKLAIDDLQTETELEIIPFLTEYHARGVEQAFVKDGAMDEPSFRLYREILMAAPGLRLIAGGGVTSVSDIEDLQDIGCSGVIIGKAISEGRIGLSQLARFL